MTLPTPLLKRGTIPDADQVLVPADDKVVLDGVVTPLLEFAVHLGFIHWLLFGRELVVTSGRDGQHAAGSYHYVGKALDLRVTDESPEGALLFLIVLLYAAPARQCTVFDERALPGQPHIHVEYHGV